MLRLERGARGVDAESVDEGEEEKSEPEESEHPEKETLRMWRSRGLDDFRRWLKPLRTCMAAVYRGCAEGEKIQDDPGAAGRRGWFVV